MTSTNEILVSGIGPRPEEPVSHILSGMVALASFITATPLAVAGLFGALPAPASLLSAVVAVVGLVSFLRLRPAQTGYEHSLADWERRQENEAKRVRQARLNFLSERDVEMPSDDVDALFPDALRAEDGLVAMSQGVVNGKATMLALHQRDGELVLTGTDGQELRPLVAA